jgi:DNA-binding winged helix-turn-helix (wHTH) protein
MNFDSDTNVIEVAIRRLRAKVDDSFELKLIHTVRGMGYVLKQPNDATPKEITDRPANASLCRRFIQCSSDSGIGYRRVG